jgi:hypothetical protein
MTDMTYECMMLRRRVSLSPLTEMLKLIFLGQLRLDVISPTVYIVIIARLCRVEWGRLCTANWQGQKECADGLFQNTIPIFVFEDWIKPRNISIRMANVLAIFEPCTSKRRDDLTNITWGKRIWSSLIRLLLSVRVPDQRLPILVPVRIPFQFCIPRLLILAWLFVNFLSPSRPILEKQIKKQTPGL